MPWQHAFALAHRLPSDDVVLTMIQDGDHRLSRPQDIARILAAVAEIVTAFEDSGSFRSGACPTHRRDRVGGFPDAALIRSIANASEYWIVAFADMTGERSIRGIHDACLSNHADVDRASTSSA